MAIAIIDLENKELQYAGANIPLFLIRKKNLEGVLEEDLKLSLENDDYELFRLKEDKQPIGVHWEEKDFTTQVIKLQDRDSLYMFTDGFADQYGGKNRKKFKSRRLKKLLLSVQAESMENQGMLIEAAFESWQGNYEQIDDVCMMGIQSTIRTSASEK